MSDFDLEAARTRHERLAHFAVGGLLTESQQATVMGHWQDALDEIERLREQMKTGHVWVPMPGTVEGERLKHSARQAERIKELEGTVRYVSSALDVETFRRQELEAENEKAWCGFNRALDLVFEYAENASVPMSKAALRREALGKREEGTG